MRCLEGFAAKDVAVYLFGLIVHMRNMFILIQCIACKYILYLGNTWEINKPMDDE